MYYQEHDLCEYHLKPIWKFTGPFVLLLNPELEYILLRVCESRE